GVTVLEIGEIAVPDFEDFDVDDLASSLDVERQRAQRGAARLDGRRYPDAAVRDDRGRPSAPSHGHFPSHVPRLAPLERQAAFGGLSLAGWPAELRPVLGANRDRNHRE